MSIEQLLKLKRHLMVVPWHDPIVDAVGFDVRSNYVELFWLNVLGPTATWTLRRLVTGLDRYPLGYELDLAETAGMLGLAYSSGVELVRPGSESLPVVRDVPSDARRQRPCAARCHRCPPSLTDATAVAGDALCGRSQFSLATWAGARLLPIGGGDEPELVERQLLAVGVSPAARWKQRCLHHRGVGEPPGEGLLTKLVASR